MNIETERLILRDLKKEDKKVLPSLVNDLEITQFLAVVPHPYTQEDANWFVDHCVAESKKSPRKNYEIGIELKKSGELIGVVGLTKVNQLDRKATLGYWLSKEYFRKGIMYEAIQELLGFAFEDLNLQRIDISAFTKNDVSIGLIKKIGATFEGVAKRYHCAKSTGKFHDVNLYGLLKEDWRKKK